MEDNSTEHADDIAKRPPSDNIQCLLTFIDTVIKPRQEYINSPLCRTVTFGDIWFLFNPGEVVIDQYGKQAYRIINVTSTRHRVKKKRSTNAFMDESKAQFEGTPVFIHCVSVDFDGLSIGPVRRDFTVLHFDGQKDVDALPIYPLRFSRMPDLRQRLIERGRKFIEVARMKHMHYTGLALETNSDVDSQVMIDFEEAFTRNPEWEPKIESVVEEGSKRKKNEAVTDSNSESSSGSESESELEIRKRKSRGAACITECCANEITHHDDYVETRRREEYLGSQINRGPSEIPSVAIIPRLFCNLPDEDPLNDDELLILSHYVFGFIMRSRKWGMSPIVIKLYLC